MVVVIVFFVCNILALVVNILEVFNLNIIALNNVSNLLVTFNSSVNFLIYLFWNQTQVSQRNLILYYGEKKKT